MVITGGHIGSIPCAFMTSIARGERSASSSFCAATGACDVALTAPANELYCCSSLGSGPTSATPGVVNA